MNTSRKYIDDPHFMKWVFNPDESTEQYWLGYLQEHADEKELILMLKEDLQNLQIKKKKFSNQEKDNLFNRITYPNKRGLVSSRIIRFNQDFMRYAALVVFCVFVGAYSTYLVMKNEVNPLLQNLFSVNTEIDSPILVLSDGSSIDLNDKSTINYTSDNGIVIDDDKIIQESGDKAGSVVNKVVVPYGSRSRIVLCDNTTVYLNAGSSLVYPSKFEKNKRDVLLSGEAYFDVSKNADAPFRVRTSALAVKVLGTKFNISAYPEDGLISTVLEEGKVSVSKNDARFFEKDIIMKPSEMMSFNLVTGEVGKQVVDTEYYTLWKDGIMIFKNEELDRVIKKLERYYNLNIYLKEPSAGLIKISGKLDLNNSCEQIFNYISTVSKIKIEKIGDKNYMVE